MPVVYDDDVAPATEPGAPPAAAAPVARGRFVPDSSPTPAAPVVDKTPERSLLDRVSEFSAKHNPLDLRQMTSGEAAIPNPIQGFLQRGGEGLETLGGKVLAGLHGLTQLGKGTDTAADAVNADLAAAKPTPVQNESTQQFEQLAGAVAKPFQAVAAPIDRAVQNAGPAVRTAVPAASEAIQDIAQVLPAAAVGRAAKVADAASTVEGAAAAGTQTPLETARGVGYQAPPSVVKASNPAAKVPGTTREAIVGPSGVQADANVTNQQVTTRLAGEELGMKDATKITAQDAANFRQKGPGPVYDATSQKLGVIPADAQTTSELNHMVSIEDPGSALAPKVATNVDRIAKRIQSGEYNGTEWRRDISWLRENGGRQAADALEDMAERHLTAAGDQTTLAAYKGARQNFAKSYDIQNAIGRGGQIDAQQIRALDDKVPGLLTGNLKIVATAARELPEVTRLPGAETGGGVHTKFQAVHNTIGGLVKKLPGMDVTSPEFQDRNFGRAQTPTEASYNPTFGRRDQAPPTERPRDPTGGLTLSNDTGPLQPQTPRSEGIPLAEVLSTGVEQPRPLGLSLAPDYRPQSAGIPFRRDAGQMAGDLQLADENRSPVSIENNRDVAGVRSQGVPEGGMQRTPTQPPQLRSDTVDLEPRKPLGMALAPGRAYRPGQREMFGKDRGAVKKRGQKD